MKAFLYFLVWASAAGPAAAADFRLISSDFQADGELAEKFVYRGMGCQGENVSPSLCLTWPGMSTR